jgi:hypothetical protein
MTRAFVALLVAGALVACAPRQKPAPAPARMQDTVPERAAALQEANPNDLREVEPDRRRFGVPQDQERKRQAKEAKEAEQEKAQERTLIPLPRMTGPDAGAPESVKAK